MGEPFVGVAFVSNSSFVTIYNNRDIEIVSIANCTSPLPSLTWEYIFGLTNIIGLTYDDQKLQQLVSENVIDIASRDGMPEIEKRDMLEISCSILKEIKTIAESHLALSVKMIVLSVPDNFNRNQQQQVRFASTLAGFDNINIITESAAAALEFKSSIKNTVALYRFYKGNFTIFIISLAQQVPVVKIIYEDICINDNIYFEMWKKGMANAVSQNPPSMFGTNAQQSQLQSTFGQQYTHQQSQFQSAFGQNTPNSFGTKTQQSQSQPTFGQQYTHQRSQTYLEQKKILQILRNNNDYKKFHLHGTPFTINRDGFSININLNIYDKAVQQVLGSKVSDIVKRAKLNVSVVSKIIDLGTLDCELKSVVAKHFEICSYEIDCNSIIRGLALFGWELLTLKVTNPMKELKIEEREEDESVDANTNKGIIEEFCRYKKTIIEMSAENEQLASSLTEATEQNKQLKNEIEIQKTNNIEDSNMNKLLMKSLMEINQEVVKLQEENEKLCKMVRPN